MPTPSINEQINAVEKQMRLDTLGVHLKANMSTLARIENSVEKRPSITVARLLFLRGVLYMRIAAKGRDGRAEEHLRSAMKWFGIASRTLVSVQKMELPETAHDYRAKLEQRLAREWCAAYVSLSDLTTVEDVTLPYVNPLPTKERNKAIAVLIALSKGKKIRNDQRLESQFHV